MSKVKAEFPDKLKCLFEPSRYKVLYGGRGSSKSWSIARALLIIGANRKIRVLCVRELQNSIKDSVHRLLSDQIDLLQLHSFYSATEQGIVGSNGTEFIFKGLRHNATSIRSTEGIDYCWVEEGQAVSKSSWNTLIPTIRKEGSEIWVSLNPEFEDDETYQRFIEHTPTNAIKVEVNYRDNPWFPDVLEQERLDLLKRSPADHEHVWEGKCRQWLDGAIYADELRDAYSAGRVTLVEHDPEFPVFTAWDLGRTDDTAIWWYQVIAGEIRILESYAVSGAGVSDLASQVLGRKMTVDIVGGQVQVRAGDDIPDLSHRRAYEYGSHWLPHDAKAKTLAAHGKSIQQQLEAALGYCVKIVPSLSLEDGIQAARMMFQRCWFDEFGCDMGIKALRKYQRELERDEISLKRKPKHDWTSHYADAFRYLGIVWADKLPPTKEAPIPSDPYDMEEDAIDWMVA